MVARDAEAVWRRRFPALFEPAHIDYADCDLHFTVQSFPLELVSRLHVLAITPAAHVVVCRSDLGWRVPARRHP